MTIIEFCGNPGCGKTTVCNQLELYIKAQGYTVINLQKDKPISSPRAFFAKVIDKLIGEKIYMFSLKSCELKTGLSKIAKMSSNPLAKKWKKRILRAVYQINQSRKAGFDYVVFDEGCIQFITSFVNGSTIESEHLAVIKNLLSEVYGNECVFVDCKLNLSENIARITKRNKINDRFVISDNKKQRQLLQQKRDNIDRCLAIVPQNKIICLDVSDVVDIEKLLNEVESKR